MHSIIDFASILDNVWVEGKSFNISHLLYDDVSFHYVSILSEIMTKHFVIITLLAIVNVLLVLPSNLLTVIVIIRNKELWTPSNIVLSINGIVQCIGTAIYFVSRSLWVHSLFLLPMHNNYKESVYMVGWWTYSLMMRTGNNRLVSKNIESGAAIVWVVLYLLTNESEYISIFIRFFSATSSLLLLDIHVSALAKLTLSIDISRKRLIG